MATETIYGCVNWATGEVEFEQTVEYCVLCTESGSNNEYVGCIVRDGGAHDGQVEVIIDNGNCDDTYYGCVNWATGQFQLVVPDDCSYYPDYLAVTLSNFTNCGTCHIPQVGKSSGTANVDTGLNSLVATLPRTGICTWRGLTDLLATVYRYVWQTNETCSGPPDVTSAFNVIDIQVNVAEVSGNTWVGVEMWFSGGGKQFTGNSGSLGAKPQACFDDIVVNNSDGKTCARGDSWYLPAGSGTATVGLP